MKTSALIAKYRKRANDGALPYLNDDEEVVDKLNTAMDEACIRAKLLTDSTTDAICTIALTDDTQTTFVLDPRILEVENVKIDGIRSPLARVAIEELMYRETQPTPTPGSPRCYAIDGTPFAGLTLTLDRPVDITRYTPMRLTVKRLQLTPLRVPDPGHSPPIDDIPEIAAQFHAPLIYWVIYDTFDGRDTDATDQKRADTALARFEALFGMRHDANVLRKRLKHTAPVCVPDGPPMGNTLPLRRRYRPTVNP